jgi:hypothetical protein
MHALYIASAAVIALVCTLGVSIDRAAAQTAEEMARRARIIASAAVGRLAVAQCDYDKWAAARTEYGDAAGISLLNPRPAAGGGLPPFPSYPVPCHPQTTAVSPASTAPVTTGFYIGPSVSTTYGLGFSNGGLGGKQSVTSPGVDLGVKTPRFETRGFISDGESEKGLTGRGTTTQQPNGGQQQIQGAGPVSGGEREAKIFRGGGEAQFNFPHIFGGRLPFVPFIGLGFEHMRLENRLFAQWAPISFTVEDTRKVETNRGYIFAGGRHDFGDVSGVDLFMRWMFQMNVDSNGANGTYRTIQVNNFDETATGSANKTAVTVGGQVSAGAATTLPGNLKLEFSTFIGAVPIWQLDYRNGQPPTLSHDYKVNWGGQAVLRIPIAGPSPFEMEALRNITAR